MIAAAISGLLLIFVLGGGVFGELMTKYAEDPIKTTIVEEDRREAALDELKSLERSVKALNKGVSKDMKAFRTLVEDYDSTPGDFDELFASVFENREQEVNSIWAQRSALLTDLSVFENVAFPLREHADLPEELIRLIVLMKLQAVGLRGARNLMPSELSGGMTRRVALARAALPRPARGQRLAGSVQRRPTPAPARSNIREVLHSRRSPGAVTAR